MALSKNQRLSKLGKKGARIRWDRIEQKVNQNIASMDKEIYVNLKSRLLGYLAGDGGAYIRKDKKGFMRYEIQFCPDHQSIVLPFVEAFRFLYLKKPRVIVLNNFFRVRGDSKVACKDLLKEGNLKTKEWEVPFNLFNTKKSKIEWLRAFFDCEAYVGRREIRVQSINEKGLKNVKNLLSELQIESNMYKYQRKNKNWNVNYILTISNSESRKTFLNRVGFNHKIKLEKLKLQFFDAKVA